ncbi:hypothetical protein COB11_05280 [Candidatus Aerophobetes bacterium]|uniref:UDP-N-acetylglucosamine pyrophosphorylase n=1 Tax=Aerophobetes bacterium TaxID=2030807 RepID=A0A2A4YF25_UNCAE|nr:MAG: hypothetical protein COB11_05280 [Candidatus Aerophobetes bacterium]
MNDTYLDLKKIHTWLGNQGQMHLIEEIKHLSKEKQNAFYLSLFTLSKHFIGKHTPDSCELYPSSQITPFIEPIEEDTRESSPTIKLLQEGKVACILLAGGDGSRLSHNKPKGCFPISNIKKKSLFALHFEKIKVLQDQLHTKLTLILLTSDINHKATQDYLEENRYFGLDPKHVLFVEQPSFPLVDESNKWFFKEEGKLALGPNGNGGLFQALRSLKDEIQKIEQFMIISIDNPLAMPFDISLINMNHTLGNDLSIRSFKRNDPEERIGIFSHFNDQIIIVDYGNFKEELYRQKAGCEFLFPYGNVNIFCLSGTFVMQRLMRSDLPIHWVEKHTKAYSQAKGACDISCYKSEKFLTDLLLLTKKVGIVNSSRDDCFAPLKNREGVNDVKSVQRALLENDRRIFYALTGMDTEDKTFELSMDFHFPTDSLIKRCKEMKKFPDTDYITSDVINV